jgi:mRNA interferase MazF
MQRGDIWWASLPPPTKSEPGYRRPVLVMQSDHFNASDLNTVVVVSITSNLRLARAPGNVLCRKRKTKLSKDSVVNVSQIATVDKTFLTERIGSLPAHLVEKVESGLRIVLAL